jgi:hypothetical protein
VCGLDERCEVHTVPSVASHSATAADGRRATSNGMQRRVSKADDEACDGRTASRLSSDVGTAEGAGIDGACADRAPERVPDCRRAAPGARRPVRLGAWDRGLAWRDGVRVGAPGGARGHNEPVGYLCRVAQSSVRRQRGGVGVVPLPLHRIGPRRRATSAAALAALSSQQRLRCCSCTHGWTRAERMRCDRRVDVAESPETACALRLTLGVDDAEHH